MVLQQWGLEAWLPSFEGRVLGELVALVAGLLDSSTLGREQKTRLERLLQSIAAIGHAGALESVQRMANRARET